MSIDPNNLKDVIWRSAVVKYSGKWDNKGKVAKPGQDMSSFDWTHTLELRKKVMERKREAANREKVFQNNEVRLKEMELERERKAEEEKQQQEQQAALKQKEEEEGMVEVTPDGPKLYVPTPLPDHYDTTTDGGDEAAKATPADPTAEKKEKQRPEIQSQWQEAKAETTKKENIPKKPAVEDKSNTPEESTEKKAGSEEQQSIAKNGRAD